MPDASTPTGVRTEPDPVPEPTQHDFVQYLQLVSGDTQHLCQAETPDWFGPVLFGGYAIAQAVMALHQGAPDNRRLHSLHAYFLRPALAGATTTFDVRTLREGRTFTSRRAIASQAGKATLDMTGSFTADTDGYVYALAPQVPIVERNDAKVVHGSGPWIAERIGPTEVRADGTRASTHRMWCKLPDALPNDLALHAACLAFATDWTDTGGRPLHLDGDTTGMISLDHAIWFHRPARADEWLFYDVHSLVNAGGRGMLRGAMHNEAGHVIISVAQEMKLTEVAP